MEDVKEITVPERKSELLNQTPVVVQQSYEKKLVMDEKKFTITFRIPERKELRLAS